MFTAITSELSSTRQVSTHVFNLRLLRSSLALREVGFPGEQVP